MPVRRLIVVAALAGLALVVVPGAGARSGAVVPAAAGKGSKLDARCHMKAIRTYRLHHGKNELGRARWLVGRHRSRLAAYVFGLDAPRQAAIQWGYYDAKGKPHVVKTLNRIVPHHTSCYRWTIPKRLRHKRTKFVQISVARNDGAFVKRLVQFVL